MPLLPLEPCLAPAGLFEHGYDNLENDGRWWVLHTKPRAEKSLARRLLCDGQAFFLPSYERQWVNRGRKYCSHLPLFPGYVFLFGDSESRLASLGTNLVVQALTVSDQAQLSVDLRRVHRLLESRQPLSPEEMLEPGHCVTITRGPLEGLEGQVIQRSRPWKLIVAVRFLQRGVSVELDDWMLEPSDRASAELVPAR